jgi:hypothetical protein
MSRLFYVKGVAAGRQRPAAESTMPRMVSALNSQLSGAFVGIQLQSSVVYQR